MLLQVENVQQTSAVPTEDKMQQWAQSALQSSDDVQLSLRIVDEDESRELNHEYRGKDKPTNVLSFPMEMPEELREMMDQPVLGDLVICASVVEKEAAEQHKTLDAHWAHMLVHGVLHLQGYDHIEDDQAAAMEQLEIQILNQLGFSNPYED